MRCAGRGRKTWRECVKDGTDELGLNPEWAVFRDMWRGLIAEEMDVLEINDDECLQTCLFFLASLSLSLSLSPTKLRYWIDAYPWYDVKLIWHQQENDIGFGHKNWQCGLDSDGEERRIQGGEGRREGEIWDGPPFLKTTFATERKAFSIRVGVHQGSVLSPLLFVIVLAALSKDFREGMLVELLYAYDDVLMQKLRNCFEEAKEMEDGHRNEVLE